MNDEVVVSFKNVSKKFCKRLRRSMAYGIMDLTKNLVGVKPDSTELRKDEFWALEDINFELRRGETLGLIGPNGSGKTTLLRLLTGIFPPDKGEISIKGRVGALIAVGAGFHPHMTGRENVYLNGAILGMSRKEIDSKFQEIIDFAEIGDFLDAPVSTYSSGMRVRLGFSIAVAIKPEILLIDEILAVGDFKFKTKCFSKLNELKNSGCASIFVSHNLLYILQYTDRCVLLDNGKIGKAGDTKDVCEGYIESIHAEDTASGSVIKASGDRFGGRFTPCSDISELEVNLIDIKGKVIEDVSAFDPSWIKYQFNTTRKNSFDITFKIHRPDGMLISVISNFLDGVEIAEENGTVAGLLHLKSLNLLSGNYVLIIAIKQGVEYVFRSEALRFRVNTKGQQHDVYRQGVVQIPHEWK